MGISTYRDSLMILPLSSVSSSASSSMFFSMSSASFHKMRPRSLADILRHGPCRSSNALRADCTAASTSCADAAATWVNSSPVAGLMVANVLDELRHSPPMSSLPGLIWLLVAVSICQHSSPQRARRLHKGLLRNYFPLNVAGRFSTYALRPSLASSLWNRSC